MLTWFPRMIKQEKQGFTWQLLNLRIKANISLKRLKDLPSAEERILLPSPLIEPSLSTITIKNGTSSWDTGTLTLGKTSATERSANAVPMSPLLDHVKQYFGKVTGVKFVGILMQSVTHGLEGGNAMHLAVKVAMSGGFEVTDPESKKWNQ
ncbi:hypothetical protein VNO77_27798 [Canavalia gladiata]|uniref:Uncharacterized protein n=1 Tax=Canavalia gladiata TaxID=3824 RepID=A0AAN9KVB3_CANGL